MRRLDRAFALLAAIGLGVALWDVVGGGFYFKIAGLRISSREAENPFTYGVIAAVLAFWLHDRRSAAAASWNRLPGYSRAFAAIAALLSVVVAILFGTFAAAGADAYGYVSQAALWRSGRLIVPEPLLTELPALGGSVAPLGYRLASIPGSLVPTYASGYPIVMALASAIVGTSAVYYVVPLFAGMGVVLTYLLAERVAGRRDAVVAAILLSVSPIFLFQSFEPMSDIPVTTWWLAVWLLAISDRTSAAFFAGVAASAAVLTRPNLVPLAPVLAVVVMMTRPRIRRGALFALGLIPGCLAVAFINHRLYGSPLESGYGSTLALFDRASLSPNLRTYPVWLLQLHSPIVYLALAAPFVSRDRRHWMMLLFGGVLWLCYLFYTPFDNWTYLRFLLPSLPLLLILTSVVIVAVVGRLPANVRGAALFAFGLLFVGWSVFTAARLGVFHVRTGERRCVAIGEYLKNALPEKAIILSVAESGSARVYSKRSTIRWDWLKPELLDDTLAGLRARGYVPYLLLEEQEERQFRDRFGAYSPVGRVDWPAAIVYFGIVDVRIYSPDDRARYIGGERMLARAIPVG